MKQHLGEAVLSVLIALALTAGPLAGPGHAAPTVRQAAGDTSLPLISDWRVRHRAFSPNRDGVRERTRIDYSLRKAARVRITVERRSGRVVRGPVRLGRTARGDHRWRWNGRNDNGRVVRDRTYVVRVRAVRVRDRGRVERHGDLRERVVVDTRAPRAHEIVPRHRRVYPRTTAFRDATEVAYRPAFGVRRLRIEVVNRRGRVVHRDTASTDQDSFFRWDARNRRDRARRAGPYDVRYVARDRAGNTAVDAVRVRVSSKRLLPQEASLTLTAAESRIHVCDLSHANGCGDFPPCGQVTSGSRFGDGALIYRSAECQGDEYPFQYEARGYHALDLPDHTRVGTAFLSLFGGPSTVGEPDVAQLSAADGPVTTPADGTDGITGPVAVTPTPRPLLTDPRPRAPDVVWSVSTTGTDSYDVRDFTISYTFYEPED